MSGAARANKIKVESVKSMKLEEQPSTMHINLKKYPMDADIGEMVEFSGKAKVVSLNKDEYGHTMRLEISKVSCEGGEEYEEERD